MTTSKESATEQNTTIVNYKRILIYVVTVIMIPLFGWLIIDFKNHIALSDTKLANDIEIVDIKYDTKVDELEKGKVSVDVLRSVLDIQADSMLAIMEKRDEKFDLIYDELKRIRDKVESQ